MSNPVSGISNRGWNDPPKLDFSSEGQTPPRKLLTQRVTHILPTENKQNNTQGATMRVEGEVLPLSAKRPDQPGNLPPPPPTSSTQTQRPSPGTDRLSGDQPAGVSPPDDDEGGLPLCEDVLSRLRDTTEKCKEKLKPRVSDDIKHKLHILEQAWDGEKLPAAVTVEMDKLSKALSERRYNEADQIHLNLMMNHISVVSGWMVGIKRLISEAKKILPPETANSEIDQQPSRPEVQAPILLPVNTDSR